nr:MAG TPA: calreticulin [Caudoviricetes sp.]
MRISRTKLDLSKVDARWLSCLIQNPRCCGIFRRLIEK